MRGNNKSFEGTNLTVVEGMHQFIMYIYSVSRTAGEERAEYSKECFFFYFFGGGGYLTALGLHRCRGLLCTWC